ncbi:hypothetical protein AN958_01321 [Leucoagaricus sp. SymC.cos]|nr:hypothetical protein AN958_01321 [Leucoagaricus sp. SymC.cos]
MNDLVSPHILSKFSISFGHRPSDERCNELCVALQTGVPFVLRHLKRLVIAMTHYPPKHCNYQPWLDLVDALVPALSNIQIINWSFSPRVLAVYPESLRNTLWRSFASYSKLRALNLTITPEDDGGPELLLQSIPQLHELEVVWSCDHPPHQNALVQISHMMSSCLALERFAFVIFWAKYSPPHLTLGEIFEPIFSLSRNLEIKRLEVRGLMVTAKDFKRHLRHFRSLEKLNITFDPSQSAASDIGEILQLLQQENIFLRAVIIDTIRHPGVFNYLSSYSGLEQLSLQICHPLDGSPELMDQLFSCVLSAQSRSLRWLELGAKDATKWLAPLTAEHQNAIEGCQLLEHMCFWVGITADDLVENKSERLVSS